jgi:hypothetical protein
MTGGSPLRITIRVALRKPLPEPSPAYGSRFKNDDRQEGAKIETCDQNLKPVVGSLILLLVILEAATGREGEEIEISAEWTRTRKP